MRTEAYIQVECDNCWMVVEVQLTTTAKGYDERDVNSDLTREGWIVDTEFDLDFCCVSCQVEYEKEKIK